jgi:diguanylate cyclase (GGDEF)-like protein
LVWRRSKDRPARQTPATDLVDRSDPALDLVADLFRGLGEYVAELGELDPKAIREGFESWARHLLVGTPAPGQADRGEAVPYAERQWPEARRYALDHHHRQHLLVRRSVGDLRDAIWAFIHGFGDALVADRATDEELKEQIARVRRAVDSPSTQEIRREAIAAVGVMGRALAERQREQRHHFEHLGERVKELREELEAARAQMERDPLTQVYNRAALDEHLKRVVDLGNLFGHGACLFMVDVDHFKWVNDTFGHAAGDEVLRRLGAALEGTLRRAEDFVARYGGDELVVVVSDDSIEKASGLGERLLEAVRGLDIRQGDETVRVTVSLGAARLAQGESPAAWLERADRALYQAKQAGRDRLAVAR